MREDSDMGSGEWVKEIACSTSCRSAHNVPIAVSKYRESDSKAVR